MGNVTASGDQPELPTLDELIEVYGTRAVVAALRAHYRVALWRHGYTPAHTDDYVAARLTHWRHEQVGETLVRAARTRWMMTWAAR